MMLESLLKNINQIIKRNSKFFEDNPELYKAVEERFSKAAYDDDEEDYGGYGTEFEDPNSDQQDEEDYGADYDLFDQGTDESEAQDEDPDAGYARETSDEDQSEPVDLMEDEGDAAQNEAIKQWMAQQKSKKQQAAPQQPVADKKPSMNDVQAEIARIRSQKQAESQKEPAQAIAEEEENRYNEPEIDSDDKEEEEKEKISSRSKWTMNPSRYKPEQLSNIMSFMQQGHSAREAEALAGAHEHLPSIDHILRRNMRPDNPSEKMISLLRPHLKEEHSRILHNRNLKLNQAENPHLHFRANSTEIINNAMQNRSQAMAAERKRLSDLGLSKFDISDAMSEFGHKWDKENRDHAKKMSQAVQDVAKLRSENTEARAQRREEVKDALVNASKGISGGEDATSSIVGDTSQIQAGKGMAEAIRQGAGGVKGEGDEASTQTGISVDPHAVMANAPKNKAFIQQLTQQQKQKDPSSQAEAYKDLSDEQRIATAKQFASKLTSQQLDALSPEMQARLKNIDGIKKREQ